MKKRSLELKNERLGPLPLVNHFIERLGLLDLFDRFVPTEDPRCRLPYAKRLGGPPEIHPHGEGAHLPAGRGGEHLRARGLRALAAGGRKAGRRRHRQGAGPAFRRRPG
ncbi:hypothetical protein HKBW3S33_00283 [Candidatus Hakubella thermalkaliphila]|uniref:Uncharacterized protein n=1 Tax=Candidatus Hakubella thermalkaliphila TaxID=2754717 RepID=A0A6V8P2T6_9ACTN|nr:hypothetical protein HKBW3S33_00283 [Candidatus Hakubella thermalkaliphila]